MNALQVAPYCVEYLIEMSRLREASERLACSEVAENVARTFPVDSEGHRVGLDIAKRIRERGT